MARGRVKDQFVVLQWLTDAAAVAGGLFAAYWLKFESGLDPKATPDAADYTHQFWWAFVFCLTTLHFCGAVEAHPRVISFNRARKLLYAAMLAMLCAAVRNYFVLDLNVSRMLFPMAFVTTSVALVAGRLVLQQIISRFLLTKKTRSRVLIVGLGPVARKLAARCKLQPELGYQLAGFVDIEGGRPRQTIGGAPLLGTREDLRRLIRDNRIDEVFVTESETTPDEFFQLFLDSDRETARVHFIPSLAEMMRSPIRYDEVAGVPVYSLRETPLQGLNAGVKRLFDIAGAGAGLLILSPVLLLIAALVKRSSPGPVLYKQTRLGLDHREFNIYKFRTMRQDAEAAGPGWGGQDDPRATPIGRLLRRTNLDELPQLWNVLRGDMSLVGPRPERPVYVDRFREMFPRYMARHAVKTGMTGWAQVHGLRGDTSINQRLRFDLYYIENWSLWLDLKIIIMTLLWPKGRRVPALRSQAASPAVRASRIELRPAEFKQRSEVAGKV